MNTEKINELKTQIDLIEQDICERLSYVKEQREEQERLKEMIQDIKDEV